MDKIGFEGHRSLLNCYDCHHRFYGGDCEPAMNDYKPIPTTKAELEYAIVEAMSLNIKIAHELRCNIYPTFKHEKLSMQLGKIATLIKYLPPDDK